jgi:uncharacterized protein (DUF2126 family)
MPHFLWEIFGVLEELRQSGYEFSPEWYSAQLEFRFPVFGRVHHGGVALELRQRWSPGTCCEEASPACPCVMSTVL